jgi:predicted DsbA family dithiol-disulfide isomerase
VHVWSDVACPWCFVGKRRFERAAAEFDGEVSVEYHAFELAPDTPVDFEGSEVDFLARHKGLPAAQVEQMLGQMTELAAGEGLHYDFDALRHTKTLLAHQAIRHAHVRGRQDELVERLFRAYFEEGRHVGRVEELVELAADAGLDADDMRTVLTDGRYADAVQQDIDAAHGLGIRGVPFYVVDGRYGISGAQSPEVFLSALRRVADERAAGPDPAAESDRTLEPAGEGR